jgi:hypothetical protein
MPEDERVAIVKKNSAALIEDETVTTLGVGKNIPPTQKTTH